MRNLYELNRELNGKGILIYGTELLHWTMTNYYENNGIYIIGYIVESKTEDRFFDKPVITFDEARTLSGINVVIVDKEWQRKYDYAYQYISPENIYVDYAPWLITKSKCVACDNDTLFTSKALFQPFLNERMFNNASPETHMMHCPKCGMYFSSYRPNDEEMGKLYSNYRDSEYQQMRHKYEAYYTEEFNQELYMPSDGGKSRMDAIIDFIKSCNVDVTKAEYVLDFGGDKGQFIPGDFVNSHKYVYEISNPTVVDGVTLITDSDELHKFKWDVILCNMVMEHLSDIKSYFSQLVSYMTDNTYLYVQVPYERHMVDQCFSFIHEHINAFGDRSFYELAKNNEVKLVKQEVKDSVIHCLFIR